MFLLVFTSFIQIVLTGLLDALIKGNIIAFYNNDWSLVPWYFKDANFIYPTAITFVSLLLAIIVYKKFKFSKWYFIFLIIWFWIRTLGIGQIMWWLPDKSFFWWYPKTAPWMNMLFYLKWLSKGVDVSRGGVFLGTLFSFCANIILAFNVRQ